MEYESIVKKILFEDERFYKNEVFAIALVSLTGPEGRAPIYDPPLPPLVFPHSRKHTNLFNSTLINMSPWFCQVVEINGKKYVVIDEEFRCESQDSTVRTLESQDSTVQSQDSTVRESNSSTISTKKSNPDIRPFDEGGGPVEHIGGDARDVFMHWSATFWKGRGPAPLFDKKREARIKARLKEGFTVKQLKDAISAAKGSWHEQNGHTAIQTLLRDAESVEMHLRNAKDKPKKKRPIGEIMSNHNHKYIPPDFK